MILQLRTEGYHIGPIHSDRGHEFAKTFLSWARNRGIHVTKTPGDDPRVHGRAEVAIKNTKTQIRKVLKAAEVAPMPTEEHWVAIERQIEAVRRLGSEVEESEEKKRKDMIWKVISYMKKRPSWKR